MHTDLLKQLAGGFEANRVLAAKAIRQLQLDFPEAFVAGAVEVLKAPGDTPGSKFVLATLLPLPNALSILCDPKRFTVAESAKLIRQAKSVDPLVGVKLAKLVGTSASEEGGREDLAQRALDVLDQTGEVATALPTLRGLMECKNADIRSKVALLIGHETRNPQWADIAARGSSSVDDARVRASAIESLWGLTTPAAKDAFRRAARDTRHRVAGAGAVALFIAGDPEGMSAIFAFARSEQPEFRATAAWAMGQTANPSFLPALGPLLKDPEQSPRTLAVKSMVAIRTRMKKVREAGSIAVRILKAARLDGRRVLHVQVGPDGDHVRGLDFRHFVVWHGDRLVETISVEEQVCGSCSQYRIMFDPNDDARHLVRVELYADAGAGAAECMESVSAQEIAAASEQP